MKLASRGIIAAFMLSSSGPALAQAGGQEAAQGPAASTGQQGAAASFEAEIIVTAQKREERLADVPISISAATGERLAQEGVREPADLVKIVPGFTYTESNYGSPVFTIRGIGLYDTAIGVAPTVTVYNDQAPLPYLAMAQGVSLDVERVEVLKGPQGTLFGQNSTGGAINYVAAKPTETPESGFDLTFGRFGEVDAIAFMSGPISDSLGARLALRNHISDGWQESVSRPGDDLGETDFTQARLILDWEPSRTLRGELVLEAWQDQSDTQAGQFRGYVPSRPGVPDIEAALGSLQLTPEDNRAAEWDADAPLKRDDWLYRISARLDADLSENITLTSITAYSRYGADSFADADGVTIPEYLANNVADVRSFFQEVRADLNFHPLTLTVGANYQDDSIDENREFPDFQASSGVFGPFRFRAFDQVVNQDAKTYSVFAGGNIEILPDLRLEGGVRYSKQDRDYEGCLFDVDGQLAIIAAAVGGASVGPPQQGECVSLIQTPTGFIQQPIITDQLDEDNVSWRAGINYKPSADSLVYASVSRGYKAGTFTPLPALFAEQLEPATQESVIAYELGAKASFADNLATFAGAIFYYDYSDKQILGQTVIAGLNLTVPQLVNVPASRVTGAEAELVLRPAQGLTLRGGLAYIDSEVTSDFITNSFVSGPININGQQFPLTPEWQASGGAMYEFSLGSSLVASIGGNIMYRSSAPALFKAPGEDENIIGEYTTVSARVGVGADDDRWRVEIWGDNIFDEYYWNNVFRSPDTLVRMTGMPATYGATLRVRFN